MILRLLPVLAGMAGCAYISDEDEAVRLDPDGDGVPIGQDCDDTDAAVGAPVTWFVDEDGDNYGLDGTETTGCEVPDLAAVFAVHGGGRRPVKEPNRRAELPVK